MTPDPDTCYRALRARDRRFDGVFFVGVRTTGVYCRPICPARTPGRDRCDFFARPAEAERAGFRACFRCRPEVAPGLAPVDSVPRLVRAAAARIEAGVLDEGSIDDLAGALGVTARHLRRAMEAELGVSPVELAQSRRLGLAKQLLHDSRLPLADVAFAAGFASVRRFNALFRGRFGRPPSALRREHGHAEAERDALTLRLDYRPPLDLAPLLAFLGARAIPGVERLQGGWLERTVRLGDRVGWLAVAADPARPALRARVSLSLAPRLAEVVARLRALFDLDAQPTVIDEALRRDARLAPLVAARPGLRVPGAFDAFETAIRVVLGQQVSVRAATTLAGRLAAALGPTTAAGRPGLERLFPTAAELARAPLPKLRALGLPAARARTVLGLARAVAGGLDLGPTADASATLAALQDVPGIGAWTAQVVALRVLHWPDAFPAGDLAVQAALGSRRLATLEALAEPWRPWRAYGVVHLWTSHRRSGG